MIAMLQEPPPPPPDFAQSIPAVDTMPPQVVVMILLAMIAAGVVILWPIARAIGRRLEGRQADPALRSEVEELRARVHELERQQARIAELEERVDFSERLLAQDRDRARLGGGG
jgi:Tfp pilus assembly protein PilO